MWDVLVLKPLPYSILLKGVCVEQNGRSILKSRPMNQNYIFWNQPGIPASFINKVHNQIQATEVQRSLQISIQWYNPLGLLQLSLPYLGAYNFLWSSVQWYCLMYLIDILVQLVCVIKFSIKIYVRFCIEILFILLTQKYSILALISILYVLSINCPVNKKRQMI